MRYSLTLGPKKEGWRVTTLVSSLRKNILSVFEKRCPIEMSVFENRRVGESNRYAIALDQNQKKGAAKISMSKGNANESAL